MLDRLDKLESQALTSLEKIEDEAQLQEWKVRYLGRSADLGAITDKIRELPKGERPALGKRANEVKTRLEAGFQARAENLRLENLDQQ